MYIRKCDAMLNASCTDGFQEANRPGTGASLEDLSRDNYQTSSFLVQMENEAFPEQENAYQMNEALSVTTWVVT